MTQDERWATKFNEVMFLFHGEEPAKSVKALPRRKTQTPLVHHNRKRFNSGQLKEERKELFEKLLALAEKCKHVNQQA